MNSYLMPLYHKYVCSLSLSYVKTSSRNIEPLIICPNLEIIYDCDSNEISTWNHDFTSNHYLEMWDMIPVLPWLTNSSNNNYYKNKSLHLYNANYWVDDTDLHTSQFNRFLCCKPSSWGNISWGGLIRYLSCNIYCERNIL